MLVSFLQGAVLQIRLAIYDKEILTYYKIIGNQRLFCLLIDLIGQKQSVILVLQLHYLTQ
jgi:hypothetical protein